jgi:hypothetical protein
MPAQKVTYQPGILPGLSKQAFKGKEGHDVNLHTHSCIRAASRTLRLLVGAAAITLAFAIGAGLTAATPVLAQPARPTASASAARLPDSAVPSINSYRPHVVIAEQPYDPDRYDSCEYDDCSSNGYPGALIVFLFIGIFAFSIMMAKAGESRAPRQRPEEVWDAVCESRAAEPWLQGLQLAAADNDSDYARSRAALGDPVYKLHPDYRPRNTGSYQ